MYRNEFKPPSDFVSEDSGGSGKNIWMWLGIGCGVVVLIAGGLMALGAWKTISCCSEMGQATQEGGRFGVEFADDLAAGDLERARGKMSDELAARMTVARLEERVAGHRELMEGTTPRLVDHRIEQGAGFGSDGPLTLATRVDFSPRAGDEKLVVLLDVLALEEGDGYEFRVDGLDLERRKRTLSAEPPAEVVLALHRELRRGEYENAYEIMSDELVEERQEAGFRDFVDEHEEIFTSDAVEIVAVEYTGQTQARVRLRAGDGGDDRAIATVDYLVESLHPGISQWRVASINPSYREEPAADVDQEPVEEDQEPVEEDDSADPNGETSDKQAGDEGRDE